MKVQMPKDKPHHTNTIHYTNSSILRITRLITIILACLLPVVSIIILYVVTSQPIRLGIVAILVTLFSLSLGLVTSANISDIFAATST
jgi:membrane protein YdbS with pleckstrin-like domain